VFRAELVSAAPASWEELFGGYTTLKAITFSSSIELLMRLAERLDDMEVVFGSKPILSKEHLAPAQASQTVQTYGFVDALADQKALVEALSRLLGRSGKALLDRVVAGTLRFRLLRGRPSHEKLYLLSGPAGRRVLTGAANLRLAAFEGRQHEVHIAFDGDAAWQLFDGYYQRDCKDRVPVEPDALVVRPSDGAPAPRDAPLTLQEVPIERVLNSGVALMDQPPRPVPAGLATDALRQAAVIGAELKDLALPKDAAQGQGRPHHRERGIRAARDPHASGTAGGRRGGGLHPTRRNLFRHRHGPPRRAALAGGRGRHPGGGCRQRRAHPGRLSGQFPRLLRQRDGCDGGLLGVPGVAVRRAGRALPAPGDGTGRHRSLGLSGLCGAVRPIERAARPCSRALPRIRCSASRR
jgi:hypothetical protein